MLDLQSYLIKEHVGLLKLADTYDIFDPHSGQQIGQAKEEPATWVHFCRFLVNKQMLPTKITVYDSQHGGAVFSIERGINFFSARVNIRDAAGVVIGYFQSKLFSIGGGFRVFDVQDRLVADITGNWTGWNFQLLDNSGMVLGTVSKQWAGFAKELFTSADNYLIELTPLAPQTPAVRRLLLAAGLAIDMIYKENQ